MLKPLLWLKLHLDRGRYISHRTGLNYRKLPLLVLDPRREAEIGTQPEITAYAHVGNGAPTTDELLAYFLMPVIDL